MMGLVSTVRASCRDCYKCVRACPVKAIRVTDGHAEVVEERCIADGRCVAICPQQAKKVESAVGIVRSMLKAAERIAISLAPSFIADIGVKPGQLVTALKTMGFGLVTETAEGAEWVAREHLRIVRECNGPLISSCCPAIVNLIEKYYPELIPDLAPVVSPMVAHGRMLKQRYGPETRVVFAGPCIAKKGEAIAGAIDAVLTFQELQQLLEIDGINLAELAEADFDGPVGLTAKIFPTPGGLAKTATLSTDLLAGAIVAIDGLDDVIEFLRHFAEVRQQVSLVDLLACRGGCLAGPGMAGDLGLMARKIRLLDYCRNSSVKPGFAQVKPGDCPELGREFQGQPGDCGAIAETEIGAILARTGKTRPEDELNCGACGYNSCREKAVAVARGMAEVDMCIPYMRAKAESKANLICQMTPNAIFVVGSDLRILEVNPAAEGKFCCKQEQIAGKPLAAVIDTRYFEEALRTREVVTGEVAFPGYNIVAWQAIFYVETEGVLIGIFADITSEKRQKEKLDLVTTETLEKAQEVINKQMRVAQEIAGLLGETTAETKVLLTKIIKLMQNERKEG